MVQFGFSRESPFFLIPHCLLFGVLIGFFFGLLNTFERDSAIDDTISQSIKYSFDSHDKPIAPEEIFLRCVIFVRTNADEDKYISSILDTYASRCNETIFYTTAKNCENPTKSSVYFYTSEGNVDLRYTIIVNSFLKFLSINQPIPKNGWTLIVNEQNYVVVPNVRHFLRYAPPDRAIVMGKVRDVKTFFDTIFPFSNTVGFNTDAGIMISEPALKTLLKNCPPLGWNVPSYTGRSMFACARSQDFEIWDPVDAEGKAMFVSRSPKMLFTADVPVKMTCCSDIAFCFGLVNYRDQRVIDFGSHQVKVFGK